MRVTCRCPSCGKSYSVRQENVGKRARCPGCGATITFQNATKATWHSTSRHDTSREHSPTNPTLPPQRLDRFEVRQCLGVGAFGAAYRAYDPLLNRDVALKVPHAGRVDDKKQVARSMREAKVAAQLNHPHIVPVFGAVTSGDRLVLVSAFIEGQTLEHAMGDVSSSFRRSAEVVLDLAAALHYSHALGIVHRDVKPANVMLDRHGRPMLMDFGLARFQDSDDKLTHDGTVLGTPAYMSPEQATGRQDIVGPASDQYALGVVFYELLCGRPPYEGRPAAVIFDIANRTPDSPRSVNRSVPKDLETICLKAMNKESDRRYTTCGALVDDLRRWLAGVPVSARPVGPAERFGRWCRRNPALAILTMSVIVLVSAFASVASVAYLGATRAFAEAVNAREQAEEETEKLRVALEEQEQARQAARTQREKVLAAITEQTQATQVAQEAQKKAEAAQAAAEAMRREADSQAGLTKQVNQRIETDREEHEQLDSDLWREWGPPETAGVRSTTASPRNFGPEHATGEPDSVGGSSSTAWGSATDDGQREWLLLEYAEAVNPKAVHVYESYMRGALVRVTVFDPDGNEIEVFRGTAPTMLGSGHRTERGRRVGMSKLDIDVEFAVTRVKLYLDSPAVAGRNQIDAVGLVDQSDQVHWAAKAVASSSYATRPSSQYATDSKGNSLGRRFGPEQATGEPNSSNTRLGYYHHDRTWFSRTEDGQQEWLLLEYAEAVKPKAVHVHETRNPGALVRVTVFDPKGNEVEVFRGADPTSPDNSRGVSKVDINVDFNVTQLKLYLDSPAVPGTNSIDAVGLLDHSDKTHWAVRAKASSTWASQHISPYATDSHFHTSGREWGPEQATGEPNSPDSPDGRAGDYRTAWASRTQDGQQEWLLLKYAEAVKPKAVHVHETYNPGALVRVTVFDPDGNEVEVPRGADPTAPDRYRLMRVSKIDINVDFNVAQLKLYLDSPSVPGWNEIDAVSLVDQSGEVHWAVKAEASSTSATGKMAATDASGRDEPLPEVPPPDISNEEQYWIVPRELDAAAWKAILPADAPPPAIAPFGTSAARHHQQAWADYLGAPVTETNSIGIQMVLIPPGDFLMGSTEEVQARFLEEAKAAGDRNRIVRIPDEGPQHWVRITRPFWMSRHEVTRGQFRRFVEETGYKTDAEQDGQGGLGLVDGQWVRDTRFVWNVDPGLTQADDHPVVNISWNDALAFCRWASRKLNASYHLPTEAQWEYACRAGTTTLWHCGSQGATLTECAWIQCNSENKTHPVAQLKPNAWGLFDMHGNVWEFCADRYQRRYYSQSPTNDPPGPTTGSGRVYRGGALNRLPRVCRAAYRHEGGGASCTLGFRVASILTEDYEDSTLPVGRQRQ